eukprot:2000325-Amphidinium_carterae.1
MNSGSSPSGVPKNFRAVMLPKFVSLYLQPRSHTRQQRTHCTRRFLYSNDCGGHYHSMGSRVKVPTFATALHRFREGPRPDARVARAAIPTAGSA